MVYNYAVSMSPHHAVTFSCLGDALCEMNRYDDAVNAYKTAIELNPSFSVPYVNLAFALHSHSKF